MRTASTPAARAAAIAKTDGLRLFKVARAVSLCDADAEDAVQRAFMIYLKRAESLEPAHEVRWLCVVVRNEALAVRRGRETVIEYELSADECSAARPLEEHAVEAERVARSVDALGDLKRDEARALLARAGGYTYAEIAQRFEWSATKTNRVVTEGRRRFLSTFEAIESGERCNGFAAEIAALAAGQATPDQVLRVKPHLKSCSGCRAAVRRLHGSPTTGVAAAFVLPFKWVAERTHQWAIRVAEPLAGASAGSGRGAAATAALSLCLGAGAMCAERVERHDPPTVKVHARSTASPAPRLAPSQTPDRSPAVVPVRTSPPREMVSARTRKLRTSKRKESATSEEFSVAPARASAASSSRSRSAKSPQDAGSAAQEFAVAG